MHYDAYFDPHCEITALPFMSCFFFFLYACIDLFFSFVFQTRSYCSGTLVQQGMWTTDMVKLRCSLKAYWTKFFAAKIFSQAERLSAEISRHNLHFKQKLAENNELNAFFTNSRIWWPCLELEQATFHVLETSMPTMLAIARIYEPAQPPSIWFLEPLRKAPAVNNAPGWEKAPRLGAFVEEWHAKERWRKGRTGTHAAFLCRTLTILQEYSQKYAN